jgi:hypothetical protein
LVAYYDNKNAQLRDEEKDTILEKIPKDLLDDLVALLTPLKDHTKRVQSRTDVTAHLPLVSLHTLRAYYKPKPADRPEIEAMRSR